MESNNHCGFWVQGRALWVLLGCWDNGISGMVYAQLKYSLIKNTALLSFAWSSQCLCIGTRVLHYLLMQRCVILLPENMLLSWRHMLKMIASHNTEKILLEVGLSRKGRCAAWNEFWEGDTQADQRTPGRLTEAGSSRVKLAEASGLDRQIEAKKDCSPAWRTVRRLASCDPRAVP